MKNSIVTEEKLEKMVREYANYITGDTDFDYTDYGVRAIIDNSLVAKTQLIELLRKSPYWEEDNLSVVLTSETLHRSIDINEVNMCANRFVYWYTDTFPEWEPEARSAFYTIAAGETQTITGANVESWNYYMHLLKPENPLKKVRVQEGLKRSKVMNRILTALGLKEKYSKVPYTAYRGVDGSRTVETTEFAEFFARYGDAINPLEVPRILVVSCYPLDFIRSSCGTNWGSCHNPNKEYYNGCNCSGGISYGLDDVTLCMYALHKEDEGAWYPTLDKCSRAMIHMGHDNQYFIMDGVYPDKTREQNEEYRQIFQRVLAECLGVPNFWKTCKEYKTKPRHYCERTDGATCYPDFTYASNNGSLSYIQTIQDFEDHAEIIRIGDKPISTTTGSRHSVENDITGDGYVRCQNCDAEIYEDDEVYSRYHGVYGCTECMRYSDYDDDYFYEDEVEWVSSYNGYVSDWALRESGDFYYCENCCEWFYCDCVPGEYIDDDDSYYCEDCFERLVANGEIAKCANCESYHYIENTVEFEGERFCDGCTSSCKNCGAIYPKHLMNRHRNERYSWITNWLCSDCEELESELDNEPEVEQAS